MLDLSTLNPQQRQAVTATEGPVLILAGAGTGKTRVITTRVAHLIAKGVAPEHVLGVTFTNKAAREMLGRVRSLIRPGAARDARTPLICTFHALGARLLRRYIDRLGYRPNFVIYDESEQLGLVRRLLSQISAPGAKADPAEVAAMLGRLRGGGSRAPAFSDAPSATLARHLLKLYESALRSCNAVDFDDLLLLTLRLFDDHPEVLEECRDQYRYIMVDEYQDTNHAQFRIVHALSREHRNLCVVGDDDQSIYGWRGAEIANLLDMEQHFPEVKVIKLEQNYRSTTTILDAANAVIGHNLRRRGKRLWSRHGQGARIKLFAFENEEHEARSLAERIEFARAVERVPWADQAVLFRTNHQSRPIETELRKAGIRYHLVGGQSFFDRREVRDFLAYLKAAHNPHDDVSLLRIANVPPRGLSDATMQRLLAASQERQQSVFGAMTDPALRAAFNARAQESLGRFAGLLQAHHQALGQPAAAGTRSLERWAEGLLAAAGYWEDLRRTEKDPEQAENRQRNLRDLMATLDEAGVAGRPLAEGLERFLEEVTLETEREEEPETKGDAVTLITMHSCKGLEFPHVHVAGVEHGLLPHARSAEEGTLDEERRLFYVAITRAQRTLALSYCTGRKRYGKLVPAHPSPFLRELPAELVETDADRNRAPVELERGREWFKALHRGLDETPG